MRKPAFTLIELLVVISIVALLLALLIPGLDRLRERGLLTASLSNAHQICLSGSAYQQDFKDRLPFTPVYRRGSAASPDSGPLEGLCPWSFCGSNNNAWWAGQAFDIEAADRPLNAYLAPNVIFDAPPAPNTLSATDTARTMMLPVVRTRGFESSLERNYPVTPLPTPGISCCDDVGAAYLLNLRWLDRQPGANPEEKLKAGSVNLVSAMGRINTARFAWFTDQSGEALPRMDPTTSWNNAFDDDNRSVMGFLDGHAAYLPVTPAALEAEGYTLVLP